MLYRGFEVVYITKTRSCNFKKVSTSSFRVSLFLHYKFSQAKRTVNMAEGITVALFYKYVPIDCVADVAANQKSTCLKLGLTGRVRLAHEGVNGLIAGKLSALQQ